jgi:hypothetical protein
MKFHMLRLAIALLCLEVYSSAEVRTVVVPAGTLMTCSLDEPKFSSVTVAVGDPFLCYPRSLQQFGQQVFPRGTYIVGHLEAAKDPGHFVGKGYLRLVFDRVGLPSGDVPITAKVVAAGDFTVDREGRIIGHGHATRDVVEWLLPPMWPWKVLTLPARGPRPAFKGETRVALRVMEDLVVPQTQTSETRISESLMPQNLTPQTLTPQALNPGWHRFGEGLNPSLRPGTMLSPQGVPVWSQGSVNVQTASQDGPRLVAVSPEVSTASQMQVAASPSRAWTADVTLFALTNGTVFPVDQYWRYQNNLFYESDGDKGVVSMQYVDWDTTTRLNAARNVRITLRSLPSEN